MYKRQVYDQEFQKSRDWKDNELPLMLLLLELPAIGAGAPIAKFVKIPGLNSGRNSWSAVGKTVLTKLKKALSEKFA